MPQENVVDIVGHFIFTEYVLCCFGYLILLGKDGIVLSLKHIHTGAQKTLG